MTIEHINDNDHSFAEFVRDVKNGRTPASANIDSAETDTRVKITEQEGGQQYKGISAFRMNGAPNNKAGVKSKFNPVQLNLSPKIHTNSLLKFKPPKELVKRYEQSEAVFKRKDKIPFYARASIEEGIKGVELKD